MRIRKLRAAAAIIISSYVIFGGGYMAGKTVTKKEAAPAAAAAPENIIYPDEYKSDLFRVELINTKNEVFAAAIKDDDGSGLYLDNNRNYYQLGDIIRAVFDASTGKLISAEKANNIYITLEDGSRVNAFKWFGGRNSDKQ